MKKFKLLSTALLGLFLSSCSSIHSYVEPESAKGLATIKNHFKREGLFDWERSTIYSIDNQPISYAFKLSTDNYRARITPGMHAFVLHSEFLRGLGNLSMSSVELKTMIEPNTNYILNETIDGLKINVWLEDDKGKRRSIVASAPIQAVPQNSTVFVPIVVRN